LRRTTHQSKTELASNILEAANGGATKTKIMYRAFLSYAQLKEYLALLTKNDLITHTVVRAFIEQQLRGSNYLKPHDS
jgi:predicted transcriptional regulator